ncbi:alpha-tocopherol transfer protein, putative [Pediculus humanus corporis]|uniref:Alpha-tocopherol transfer protein, putative n=1 Tax=Pediculus humanus subsp. corporis TaxID=121224 RepID=E0VNQ3_PEDHC|nr:alpha-tocopherol transfer protein, putative [Pediculus humanus corporis]EEB15009.1 alpha-tocopherol transfer protein, putative [Pediculus humanus corporis]
MEGELGIMDPNILEENVWEDEDGNLLEGKSESEPEIDFHEELIKINNWLSREPYLPKHLDEELLITFLWNSQDVAEAQDKLMNYYYARQSMKSVFEDRHPCSPNNLLKYDAVCVVPLTNGLDKKWIIFATWLSHDDPSKFSMFHVMKLIFTELDILLQENQIRGKTVSVIIDMKGFTKEHTDMITKFGAHKMCSLFTDSFPAKFNGFYIINAPQHVSDYTTLFKPFDFHIVKYLEDLPGFLPKRFLTCDLAGEPDAPTRECLFDPFFKRLRRCGNWLAYEEYLRSQEMMLRMTTTRAEFNFGAPG